MVDAEVTGYSAEDNTLTVLEMASFSDVRGEFCRCRALSTTYTLRDLGEIVSEHPNGRTRRLAELWYRRGGS